MLVNKRHKLIFGFLIFITILSCDNPFDQYHEVNLDSELSLLIKNHRNDRGSSILNEKYLFVSFCPLTKGNNKSKNNELYFAYKFIPYHLYKRKGDDYFYIIKDNDSLKYELIMWKDID